MISASQQGAAWRDDGLLGNNINGGYRCGATEGLNGNNAWDRVVYHAD